ncbi:MAG TPA: DUF3126 family protein [Acetobacteraceae bacterium]|jgi:hypothetical protein
MTPTDIARLQTYLRRLFASDRIRIVPPARKGLSVEFAVEDEVIGTVHQDTEDGETSYSVHLTVLEEDLAPIARSESTADKGRRAR